MNEHEKSVLRDAIATSVFITNKTTRIIAPSMAEEEWLMDFRKIIFRKEIIQSISRWVLSHVHLSSFQICGLEMAAVPVVTGVVYESIYAQRDVNGFFMRKSRKKTGALNMIEGEMNNTPVVIFDDLINSGGSVLRQIKIIESMGVTVEAVFCILRFRDESYYRAITEKGIRLVVLFSLDDFSHILPVHTIEDRKSLPAPDPFAVLWGMASKDPHYEWVVPKSAPLLVDDMLFFGTDSGDFYALDALNGSVVWKHRVFFGAFGKRIFSAPCHLNGVIFYGAYDGNFYALKKDTGEVLWVARDADWIGSSPCVSKELGLVYVGMEYGFIRHRGGVAAFDVTTGKRKWLSHSTQVTHGSPSYSKKHMMVVCGSNDGVLYALSARKGGVLWTYASGGEIKARPIFSPSHKYVAFGSFNKTYTVLDTKTGKEVVVCKTLGENYTDPVWEGDRYIICASLDKHLYKFDISTGEVVWKVFLGARNFANPVLHNGHVIVGNNTAVLWVIDLTTGAIVARHQTIERITNQVIIDTKRRVVYMPTYANEVFALTVDESLLPLFSSKE